MIDYDKLTDLSGIDGLSGLLAMDIVGKTIVLPASNVCGLPIPNVDITPLRRRYQGTSSGGNSRTWLQVSRLSFRNWRKYD